MEGPGHHAFAGVDERELAARREDLLDYMRGSLKRPLAEADLEDAVQTAWAEVLGRQRDEPIRDLRAFMAEVAWRSAYSLIRRPRPLPLDPDDPRLVEREDPDSSLADRVGERAEVARAVEALEQLGEGERDAFALWFVEEVSTEEACRRLGIRRSAYFKRLKAAKAHVERAMAFDSHLFDRRQHRLLSDYVAGLAEGRARARAERLIAADPQAAALARELRRAHEAAALALPVLGFASAGEPGTGERLAELVAKAHDAILGLLGDHRTELGVGLAGVADADLLGRGPRDTEGFRWSAH
ncbi:MAG: hypothetical protein GEU88_18415 [Solirubrobacterales bacterium]|nr:hypothetical protein [Solirubrobacterales bacterium]